MTSRRDALAVRKTIEAARPEIAIATPVASLSGLWELCVGGETSQYDDFWLMVEHLAARYDNDDEPDDEDEPEDRLEK